jgi:membrane protease YdiL (CAAX protease family)
VFFVLALGVSTVVHVLHLQVKNKILVLLPGQFLMYGYVFAFLALLFRVQYDRPLWESLRWRAGSVKNLQALAWGLVAAFAVAFLGVALKTPDINNPMKELLSEPMSLVLVGILGVTIGPVTEEVVFRGFMQPLFVRSLGPVAGVLLAAALFGLMHLQEYGNSWRHGVLIATAGAAFGWMRQASGSTRAAALMHAAYNGTQLVAVLLQRKELSHTW